MKNKKNIVVGLILLTLGVLLSLRAFDIIDFNIFFKGWWTLFLIVPSFIALISGKDKMTNLIVLIVGVFLLLSAQGIISFSLLRKLILPIILVVIGLGFIFKEMFKKNYEKKKSLEAEEHFACFSSNSLKVDKKSFKGADLDAVFGSITLDLTEAKLDKETVIEADAIFASILIVVPEGINVVMNTTSFLASSKNRVVNSEKNGKTLYVEGNAIFSEVEVK